MASSRDTFPKVLPAVLKKAAARAYRISSEFPQSMYPRRDAKDMSSPSVNEAKLLEFNGYV